MSLFVWILLGLVFGLVAGQAASCAKLGVTCTIALGITLAAVAGACADHVAGGVDVTRVQLWTMIGSMVGAVIVLVAHEEHGSRLLADLKAPAQRV